MLIKQTLYFRPRHSARARCPCSTLTQNRHGKLTYFKLWVVNGSDGFPCCPLNSDWNGAVLGCWASQWQGEFSHRLRYLTSHLDTVLRPCSSLRIHSRKEEDQCLSSQHFQDMKIATFLFLVTLKSSSQNCLLVIRRRGILAYSLVHGGSYGREGGSHLCRGKETNLRKNVLIMWFGDSEKGNNLKNKAQ